MMTLPLWLALMAHPALPLPQEESPGDVRLIVLVVVDQMIPEQLQRMQPWLQGGLARFAQGEVWHNGIHAHSKTQTGPGHATLGTGRYPNRNGIVSNVWTDNKSGQSVYCVNDPNARLLTQRGLGAPGSSTSSKNLRADGFSEYMHAVSPAAKCISIAGKDRSALLAAGRNADLALWWERGSGLGFCSSDAYATELPSWTLAWNRDWARRAAGWSWQASVQGLEASGMAADLRAGEPSSGFPHVAPSLGDRTDAKQRASLAGWVYGSPLVDQFVLEMAGLAVTSEALGTDSNCDFLFVGLSACDTIGHGYGPYSQEVTDLMLRVDRQLELLFAQLDERVGKEHWIAALSSDHGVLPLPEALPAKLIPGQRVRYASLKRADLALRAEVHELFGEPYFKGLSYLEGRLDLEALEADGIAADEVASVLIEGFLERVPWLHAGYTRKQLKAAQSAHSEKDSLLTLCARSFHPERSLDFQLITQPWVLISGGNTGTSHGSPWPYDTRVPIAFIGPGSETGKQHFENCQTVDILPTLLKRAGLPVPADLDGKVLR